MMIRPRSFSFQWPDVSSSPLGSGVLVVRSQSFDPRFGQADSVCIERRPNFVQWTRPQYKAFQVIRTYPSTTGFRLSLPVQTLRNGPKVSFCFLVYGI